MSIQGASAGTGQAMSSVSNMQQLQQMAAGQSGADSDRGAGGIGKSNFVNAIMQALGQGATGTQASSGTAPSATATAAASTTPQAALQSFMQTLSAALGQTNGGDSDGDKDDGKQVSGGGRQGSNMTASIQNLLQQLSTNSPATPETSASPATDILGTLNTSYQNLMTSMNSAQGQTPASTPTLPSFLQNFMQNMNNGQNISGAMISTQA